MSFVVTCSVTSESVTLSADQSLVIANSLRISNEGSEAYEGLRLEMSGQPEFFEKQILIIDKLAGGAVEELQAHTVKLCAETFYQLAERTTARVHCRLLQGEEVVADCEVSVALIPPPPCLAMTFDRSVNYAFQQNAIPFVKELRLRNNGVSRRDVLLRLNAEPSFAEPAEIRLQALEGGGEFRLAPVEMQLSHNFLAELNERVSGFIRLEMLEGEQLVQTLLEPVSLLARNEWCGLVALPEILAAFVLPNDPAVMTVLGEAASLLENATGRSSLNGYQDKSRKRVWEQVAAIYKAIAGLGLRYINPPASFESTGQKVRFPAEMLSQRFGTCLDLVLLFAACCEQAGLRPLILMHEGHAYAGCWLEEGALPAASGDDLQQIRKLVADEFITVFETTTVTSGRASTLNDAELLAKPYLNPLTAFRLALDVRAARAARILPLPVPGQAPGEAATAVNSGSVAAAGIGNREFAVLMEADATGSAKTVTRIDLWKSRLLDLSLRNRLLNFRETKTMIRMLCAEPEHVEDALAAEKELTLRPRPKVMSEEDPRHPRTYTKEQRADALLEHLREALNQGRLHTALEEAEHAKRLTELYRAARNALDENGTNTLYAAVGILEWRETEHSDKVHCAPLLLVPVELKRKSVLEGFSLHRLDEDARLNVTLMEMLRQDFRKEIPGLDLLPEDENGVDVARVLHIFRGAVRDLKGWEVKSEVWLGQFSFTKFLLWKDLSDRLDALTQNRVVSHLVNEAGTMIANPWPDIRPEELDDRFRPREVLCPRSADSSQLAAVMAAAAGHDFILEGPPGTGKSQTITNIIAHCLAVGKRVLFVAEKRAALDVVHRRLREDGLEPFCLELHSNKTGKTEVLAQFDRTLNHAGECLPEEWEQRTAELERLRTSLNAYTRALHRRMPCGLSAWHCLDYLLPRKDEPVVALSGWVEIEKTSAEALHSARETARQLQGRSAGLRPLASHPLACLACSEWSPPWAERALQSAVHLSALAARTRTVWQEYAGWLQFSGGLSLRTLRHFAVLNECLRSPQPVGAGFPTTPWRQLSADLVRWRSLVQERVTHREALRGLLTARDALSTRSACEQWTESEARERKLQGEDALRRLHELQAALPPMLHLLGAEHFPVTAARSRALAELALCLLSVVAVGPAFAAPCAAWSEKLTGWQKLIEERNSLRPALAGYDEAKLLELDLTELEANWQKVRASWLIPKLFGTAAIQKTLQATRPDGAKPEVTGIGSMLPAGRRIQEIQRALSADRAVAESLLGGSWQQGEPVPAMLVRIQEWGAQLERALLGTAGDTPAWQERIRELMAEWFRRGPAEFNEDAPSGRVCKEYADAVSSFSAALAPLVASAGFDSAPLGAAPDYTAAVEDRLRRLQEHVPRLREINAALAADTGTGAACLGSLWNDGEPDAQCLAAASTWGETLHTALAGAAGDDAGWLGRCRQQLSALFHEGPAFFALGTSTGDRLAVASQAWTEFLTALEAFAAETKLNRGPLDSAADFLAESGDMANKVAAAWPKIREWCSWQKARSEAEGGGLHALVEHIESDAGGTTSVLELFERSFRRALLYTAFEQEGALREFFGREHGERIIRFRELDERLASLTRALIRARLASGIPRENTGKDIPREEIGLLRKEIAKKARHLPVRQLLTRIPRLLPKLKPCVLMSPLSVAQYLEASAESFDVVIFDEASQIPVWDAVGAIARGKQLIVVGDPKQLPPTNFFAGQPDEDGDTTPQEYKDLESILDELLTHGLRHKRLQWHYRSRHEGLITFSNRQYYGNELLTFPSPELLHGGVRLRHLPDARYDKGNSRTNRGEAEALVGELVTRLRDGSAAPRSYGVVTFSLAQQQLIENLLDEVRRTHPDIEEHFGDAPPVEGEPVFVKNLENVQGDERDVILFSICYGPDEAGKVSMNFGPLNRDGGERRLNVAATRAKHEVIVFSSIKGDQIDLTRTRSRGVRDLKLFLDYAERGPKALAAATLASGTDEAESEFEQLVARRLQAAGHVVHHQVGCSGYRIDLAVVDPQRPGSYLLGIECDGATYHRGATARDRDKLRQSILEGLGWKLHRIWSTDWWHDSDSQMALLEAALQNAVTGTVQTGC